MTPKEQEEREKLHKLQDKHRHLLTELIPLQADFKSKSKELDRARRALDAKHGEIKKLGEQIFHLKHSGDTPHVTDHAIVRYLERVEGVDIWDLRSRVSADKNAVKVGNVIVTVNEELEDEQ